MDEMDVVPFVFVVRRGAVDALVWEVCVSRHAGVVYLYLMCILWQSLVLRSA